MQELNLTDEAQEVEPVSKDFKINFSMGNILSIQDVSSREEILDFCTYSIS